jgi:hypothetical protein
MNRPYEHLAATSQLPRGNFSDTSFFSYERLAVKSQLPRGNFFDIPAFFSYERLAVKSQLPRGNFFDIPAFFSYERLAVKSQLPRGNFSIISSSYYQVLGRPCDISHLFYRSLNWLEAKDYYAVRLQSGWMLWNEECWPFF